MKNPKLQDDNFRIDELLTRKRIFSSEDIARFSGCAIEKNCAFFKFQNELTINLPCENYNLTEFNSISLKLYNSSISAILVGIELTYGIKKEKVISFTGAREPLIKEKWIELKFPLESFGFYGSHRGFSNIKNIQIIFKTEKTEAETKNNRVLIHNIYVENRKIPYGTRLTEAGLKSILKEDIKGITNVIQKRQGLFQVRANNPFTSENNGLFIPPPHTYPIEKADEIIRGNIMGQKFLPDELWKTNITGDLEWNQFLHRHHFIRVLVKAFLQKGDEIYVRAVDNLIKNWIISNPVPLDTNGGAGPSWETLAVGWRLREWMWVAGIMWQDKTFSRETKSLMVRSIWEHARSLMDYTGHRNNCIIVESAALAITGMIFPEFHDAKQWFETGIYRLKQEISRQFFSDGVHFELSPLYHGICLNALLDVKKCALKNNIILPEEFDSPLERASEYLLSICRPDFTWPSINDSWGISENYTELMRLSGEIFSRPDFTWIGARGELGNKPKGKTKVFSESGMVAMRSGYEGDANFLLFRAGPPGAFHSHGDTLSLDITSMGVKRLVDPGITSYSPDILTNYYRSAIAHNTILIDGKGPDYSRLNFQSRIASARENLFYTNHGELEVATGICYGPWENRQDKLIVSRTVIFVKGEYWIIRDIVTGRGHCQTSTCWQCCPGRVNIDIDTFSVNFKNLRGPQFVIIPLEGSYRLKIEKLTGETDPVIGGWMSHNGCDVPAISIRFNSYSTLPMNLIWLLIPYRGAFYPRVKSIKQDPQKESLSFKIVFSEDYEDHIIINQPNITSPDKFENTHGKIYFERH